MQLDGGVYGEKCLRINGENTPNVLVEQVFMFKPGNHHLSFLSRSNASTGHAYVEVEIDYYVLKNAISGEESFWDETDAIHYVIQQQGNMKRQSVNLVSNKEWTEYDIKDLNVPTECNRVVVKIKMIADQVNGDIYFDDFQWNKEYHTGYNLIENGFFEYEPIGKLPRGWLPSGSIISTDRISYSVNFGTFDEMFGNRVLSLGGNKDELKRVTKSIDIIGGKDDEFMLVAWSKGKVFHTDLFRMKIEVLYYEALSDIFYFDFNKQHDTWEMMVKNFLTKHEYYRIHVSIEHQGPSYVDLDAIQLYRSTSSAQNIYDEKGNLIEQIHGKLSTTYVYDDKKRVIKVNHSSGKEQNYQYNMSNQLTLISDNKGNSIANTYDTRGNKTISEITSNAGKLRYKDDYDSKNRLIATADDLGNQFRYETYNKDGQPTRTKNSEGIIQSSMYNDYNQLYNLIQAKGTKAASHAYTYNTDRSLNTIKAGSTVYQFVYDEYRRLKQVKVQDLVLDTYEYDSNTLTADKVTKKIYGNNADEAFTFTYDDQHRVKKVQFKGTILYEYFYNRKNQVHCVKTKNDIQYFSYDDQGRLTQKTQNNGDAIHYDYDNQSNLKKMRLDINSMVRSYDFIYDQESRNMGVSYENMEIYESFDTITFNQMFKSKQGIQPLKYAYTPDATDQVRFVYDEQLSRFVYRSYVNSTSAYTSALVYDLGLKSKGTMSIKFKVQLSGKDMRTIIMNKKNNLDVFGAVIKSDNRLYMVLNGQVSDESVSIADNQWQTLVLKWSHNQYELSINNSERIYKSYDTLFMKDTQTIIGSNVFNHNAIHLLEGTLEMMAYNHELATDDEVNRLSGNNHVISIQNKVDELNRIEKEIINTGNQRLESRYHYKNVDDTRTSTQLERIEKYDGSIVKYSYDKIGNVTKVETNEGIYEYNYDHLVRLEREYNPINHTTTMYTYIAPGNMSSKKVYVGNVPLNGSGTLVENYDFIYNPLWPDRLEKVLIGGQTHTIDYQGNYAGNPSQYDGLPLTWEGKDLVEIRNNRYRYNSDGIRISKSTDISSVEYTLNGTNIVAEKQGSKTTVYHYNQQEMLVGFEYEKKNYFYVRDLLGLITEIIDENGQKVVSYRYDAWGNIVNKVTYREDVEKANNFVYKGYYLDRETGWYYLKSRYYNPKYHRFINADSIDYLEPDNITGTNLFAYCGNNPVMYSDPSGNFPILLTMIIIGALVGGGLGGYAATQNGATLGSQDFWIGVGTGALLGGSVGAVIGLGGAYLASGVSSLISKGITDMVSVAFFGGEIGSLQSYALAFSLGGLTGGFLDKLGKATTFAQKALQFGIKFGSDVALRPALSQGIDIGLGKQSAWNWNQYGYDVVSRGLTYFIPGKYKTNSVFGELTISPFKAFGRGIVRGLYPYFDQRFNW